MPGFSRMLKHIYTLEAENKVSLGKSLFLRCTLQSFRPRVARREESQNQWKGEESHPLGYATGGELRLLIGKGTYSDEVHLTYDRQIWIGFLKLTRIFLNLQKEINLLTEWMVFKVTSGEKKTPKTSCGTDRSRNLLWNRRDKREFSPFIQKMECT